MNYIVTLGQSKKELQITTNLSISDILLLVVEHFGEEWYGCTVKNLDINREMSIPSKATYNATNPNKSVYEWAIESHNISARLSIDLEEADTVVINNNPFTEVKK